MVEEIKQKLIEKWELWEFLWEGNDRIVFCHKKNKNLVIKIPKTDWGKRQNAFECKHYLEEENLRIQMGKELFPNWLARCAYYKELWVSYMQKLEVMEWSDFGVIPNTKIARKFDLNF